MTYHVDITDASHRLLDLIRAAKQGEEVIITENQRPVIQLVAIAAEQPRPQFGSALGQVTMSDDFDEPLEDFREYLP